MKTIRIFALLFLSTFAMLILYRTKRAVEKPFSGRESILSCPAPLTDLASPQLCTDPLTSDDFSMTDGHLLTQWFSGGNQALAEDFTMAFQIPEYMTINHPRMNPDEKDYNCMIYCYWKPYEYNQQYFLEWLSAKRGMNDYLPANARRFNDYKGNLANPIVSPGSIPKPDDLKKSWGKQIRFDNGHIYYLQDNRLNPARWWAPNNMLMHHETTSIFMVNPVSDENIIRVQQIMEDYLTDKDRNKKLILRYKAGIRVEDYRNETGEHTIFDMYSPGELENGTDLLTFLHRTWRERAHSNTSRTSFEKNYMERRLENPFIQISVCLNMCAIPNRYLLQEFMVFNKDYLSTTTGYYNPLNNARFNEWIFEGGCNSSVAWNRYPIDKLKVDGLTCTGQFPVALSGGEYVNVSGDNSQLIEREVNGVIDITNYYVMARNNDFFPGERWTTEDGLHGFNAPGTPEYEPDFKPSIYWAGFMFEMTGPYKLEIEIKEFDITIE